MSVSGIQSQRAQTTLFGELFASVRKQQDEQLVKRGIYSRHADTVSFSSEAMSRAASLHNNSGASSSDSFANFTGGEEGGGSAALSAGAGGTVGMAAKKGNSSIEKQITALQEQMATIQGSNLPEGTKSAMISGLQAQISALLAQLEA